MKSKVVEFFGENANSIKDINEQLTSQVCPYTCKRCIKTRKSDPSIAIGTCTVLYQNSPIIICPFRLLDKRQVFLDCLHLLSVHEPGNELYVIPEVSIPGGNVDYFLTSVKNKKVVDFVGIEFQTLDTTGTVWWERQRLLKSYGVNIPEDLDQKKSFGMNWKMTAKTILVQMHHKAGTFEKVNRHIVLIVQKQFLDYIKKEFDFKHVGAASLGDSVHFHAYDLNEDENAWKLALKERLSTDESGVAKLLGLNATTKVEFSELCAILETKLADKYRLTL